MSILADIGGTHARFALAGIGGPEAIVKYKAADFENLDTALRAYCQEQGREAGGKLRIAAAGSPEDSGLWRFVNCNTWIIDPKELKSQGWQIEIILNDFEAAAWSLPNLQSVDLDIIRKGEIQTPSKCILGPGTGLGLAYVHYNEGIPFVQPTHGGHLPMACLSDEQAMIMQVIQRFKDNETAPVYENVVSGPGLHAIYRALCLIGGMQITAQNPEDMMGQLKDPKVEAALRLFHEFLGLFAATAVIAGHAYGGLYLTGGVIERLKAAGQFDARAFERWFNLNAVAPVMHDLGAMPIYHIIDPYPALKGLMYEHP